MNIVDIREVPELIGILSEYHQKEWEHLCPRESLDGRKNRMRLFLKDELIPTMFVARVRPNISQMIGTITCFLNLGFWVELTHF